MVTRLDRLARLTRDLSEDDGRRAFDAGRARRASGVRARVDPRPHWRRPERGEGAWGRAWDAPSSSPHTNGAKRFAAGTGADRSATSPAAKTSTQHDFTTHGVTLRTTGSDGYECFQEYNDGCCKPTHRRCPVLIGDTVITSSDPIASSITVPTVRTLPPLQKPITDFVRKIYIIEKRRL